MKYRMLLAAAAMCLGATHFAAAKGVKNYTFTLAQGATKTIDPPAGGYPIEVQAAVAGAGGTLPGSQVVNVSISEDPSTTQLSCLATGNLGKMTVGNTTTDSTVTQIYLPNNNILATVSAASGGKFGTLTFQTDAANTGKNITFYASVSYRRGCVDILIS
jgi:hypothetical protein